MKISNTILLTLFSILFFSFLDSQAQQFREMQPLDDHDFECLQSLDCAQNSQSLKSKGWSFMFDETVNEFTPEFTARMKGENISLFAIYDGQGNLIRSTYKRENVALPKQLLVYLNGNNFEEWQISGSEMVVKDFDPASVRYTVHLENGPSLRSEVYNYEFISGLQTMQKGLVKQ